MCLFVYVCVHVCVCLRVSVCVLCVRTELMQTEMHHVRTLKNMQCVYVRELRDSLQMEERRLDCLFPRLENLLELHTHFLSRLRERRRNSLEPGSDRNYCIQRLADVLVSQVGHTLYTLTHTSWSDR